jgi:DNA repair photolyase
LIPLIRRGTVLRPSALSDELDGDVFTLNLMVGCPLLCTFYQARAFPNYPGDDVVYFYEQTAERLRRELTARKRLPRAVHLCPITDPFPPYLAIQEEVCRVIEVLAEFHIEAWLMTRGYIRPLAVETLVKRRSLVRSGIAITTADNRLRRILEPFAAPPAMRLKLLKKLREFGVATQVALDPLMPGLTDTRANLEPLLDELARAGVTHVTAGYMFLRRGMREILERELKPYGWAQPLLRAYEGGPVMPMGALAPAQHLPRHYRQGGYALLMALAAQRNITVSVSGLTNPDFKRPRPVSAPRKTPQFRQLELL